jgi:hypothetical protein
MYAGQLAAAVAAAASCEAMVFCEYGITSIIA